MQSLQTKLVQSEKQSSRLKLEKQQIQEKLAASNLGKLAAEKEENFEGMDSLHVRIEECEGEYVVLLLIFEYASNLFADAFN